MASPLLAVPEVSTSGVNVSGLFIAEHSEVETAGAVEREGEREREGRKKAGPDKSTLFLIQQSTHKKNERVR